MKKLNEFKEEFLKIKNAGYIESDKDAQELFDDLIKNKEAKYPNTIIKIKDDDMDSYAYLLNSNDLSREEKDRLRKKYGVEDKVLKTKKNLFMSVQANCCTNIGNRYLFRLNINYEQENIYLQIYDNNLNLVEHRAFWTFKSIEKEFLKYPKYYTVIKYWYKEENGKKYYKFYDLDFYELKDFNNFIKLLEDGTIRITFNLGIYHSGYNVGKLLDKGICFEIQKINLNKLYNLVKI